MTDAIALKILGGGAVVASLLYLLGRPPLRRALRAWTAPTGVRADDAGWRRVGPSTQPEFHEQEDIFTAPIEVMGYPVRCGTRTHVRYQSARWRRSHEVETKAAGFLALVQADLPERYRVPLRIPATTDRWPDVRLIRQLWSDLEVQLDDRLEIGLGLPPNPAWGDVRHAALRLITGLRALVTDERAFVAWLAEIPPVAADPETTRCAREDQVWRGLLLIEWFPDHPTTLALARREVGATKGRLQYESARLLDDLDGLGVGCGRNNLSFDLQKAACMRAVELAVARGEGAWLSARAHIDVTLGSQREALARALLKARDPSLLPFVMVVFRSLTDAVALEEHIELLLAMYALTERLGGAPEARVLALTCRVTALAAAAEHCLGLGPAGSGSNGPNPAVPAIIATCLALLETRGGPRAPRDPYPLEEVVMVSQLALIGRLGGEADLPALRRWTQVVAVGRDPTPTVRAAAQAAIEAIVQRQPREQAGALSVVDGEAGALTLAEAEPGKAPHPKV